MDHAAKDYAGSRYSTLDDITADNASRLTVAWTFSTGVLKGHEGAPLVIGQTMYIVTPYPNVAYALDLSRPGAPLRWKFRPENDQRAKAEACCDVVNRGAAYADSTVFYNLLDGHTVAVDARTGAQRWRTPVADPSRGETMTMAPLVVHGKVLVGPSGGEMGVRGWIAALDAHTGKEVWRAYNLGPDADVRIGPRFAPFYASERGADLGATSWPSETWRHGARPRGGGSPTIRNSISCTMARAIPVRGIASSGWATTNTRAPSWRATRIPGNLRSGAPGDAARRLGITTPSMKASSPTCRSVGRCAKCSCTSTATGLRTRSTVRRGKCSSPSPTSQ